MKRYYVIAAAALTFAACQKNKETTVETENTVIEGKTDTISIDTDTIAIAPVEEEKATPAEVAVADNEEIVVKPAKEVKVEYASFGDKIMAERALSKDEMLKKYSRLKAGDTVAVKFRSKIKDVCQKKGCWMSMELPNGKESFVKFRDYAFFVPLNAAEQEAIVSGKAFVSEISVAQLKHYAKDGGKSEAEIAKITEPEFKYGFMADGVLISK